MTITPRLLAVILVATLALAGCATPGAGSKNMDRMPAPANPALQTYPDIDVVENVPYGAGEMLLDVCLPHSEASSATAVVASATTPARAAVISVHGGSWSVGDKASVGWRSVCQWLASEGFVAVSVNYRLAPTHPFPAGIEDVRQAVRWLREPAQVERFDFDPDRIGAFGGSAGGNLAALLGLEGEGDVTSGSRVAAVVDLSGPIDLTTDGFALGDVVPSFRDVQLAYLGCASYNDCAQSVDASPLYDVDSTDPPIFVAHSLGEWIPIEQSDALVDALRNGGVDTTYATVDGTLHSIAMLDDVLRARIGEWLRSKLTP